jgi:Flp pilus assembly pilin Flp
MRRIRGHHQFFAASLARLARDESGQGTMEYILLLSIIVTGAAAFARAVVGTLDSGILRLGGALEKDLKTGRAQVNVWEN